MRLDLYCIIRSRAFVYLLLLRLYLWQALHKLIQLALTLYGTAGASMPVL